MSNAMSKTEAEARESVARKGFWIGRGKRAFDVAKRMQARAVIAGASYKFDAYNGNSSAFRSQWDSPRVLACYEVLIQATAVQA
jgi:hypothetical protein